MAKVSPVGLALIVTGMICAGVLGGFFFNHLQVTMRSTVTTHGMEVMSVFLWDGAMLTTNKTNILCDITELTAGESQVFPHTLKNVDNGLWEITIDMSAMEDIFENEMNPFYGFSLVVTPDTFLLAPGQEQMMVWKYSLNHEFLDPKVFQYNETDNMPFNVSVNIALFEGVISENDLYSLPGETNVIFPLVNDEEYQITGEKGLTITEVTQAVEGGPTLVSILPDGTLSVYMQNTGTIHFTYTVTTDTTLLSDTASVTYTRTA
jgi:hypothetical protein